MDDGRDNRIVCDVNGDMFFVTRNGTRIQVRDSEEARKLEELERQMEWYRMFPMGMK